MREAYYRSVFTLFLMSDGDISSIGSLLTKSASGVTKRHITLAALRNLIEQMLLYLSLSRLVTILTQVCLEHRGLDYAMLRSKL